MKHYSIFIYYYNIYMRMINQELYNFNVCVQENYQYKVKKLYIRLYNNILKKKESRTLNTDHCILLMLHIEQLF